MRFHDVLATAFLNLWRRKFRAFLTVLGMVIGVASIVVMVSLGIGIREATISSFESTGSLTTIRVNAWSYIESEDGRGTSREVDLTQQTLSDFRQIAGVSYVMPVVTAYGMLKSGRYATDAQIIGIDEESAKAFDFTLSEGRFPASASGSTYEIVLGQWTLENFYNPDSYQPAIDANGNPKVTLDSRFELTFDYSNIYGSYVVYYDDGVDSEAATTQKGAMYKVKPVGVMSREGNDYSYYCLMEINALEKLIKANKDYVGSISAEGKYESILVKCASIDEVKSVQNAIEAMGYGPYSLQDAGEVAQG
ncbi:MAG: ABC transporter permease, partial [Clostridia bacterium]|nr:ABC transporter permease [Clostridia bacterium]